MRRIDIPLAVGLSGSRLVIGVFPPEDPRFCHAIDEDFLETAAWEDGEWNGIVPADLPGCVISAFDSLEDAQEALDDLVGIPDAFVSQVAGVAFLSVPMRDKLDPDASFVLRDRRLKDGSTRLVTTAGDEFMDVLARRNALARQGAIPHAPGFCGRDAGR